MRNNQDRLGTVPGGDEAPIQQAEQSLQFVTPTEFVDLPSKGRYYPPEHPLHNAEMIEIRHMTAKDEDILTSRSLLKKGIAIDRLLQNVLVDRRVRVEDLLIGDKNAIIIASRITGYGAEYEAGISCPSCASAVQFSFNLEECQAMSLDRHDNSDIRVNGQADPGYVDSFIQHMPASDSRKIRTAYQEIIPNVDMNHEFVCSECSFEGEVSVPFGATFFWPQ